MEQSCHKEVKYTEFKTKTNGNMKVIQKICSLFSLKTEKRAVFVIGVDNTPLGVGGIKRMMQVQ